MMSQNYFVYTQVCTILTESTKVVKGARVEHNKYCVTVHFRNVKEEVLGRA